MRLDWPCYLSIRSAARIQPLLYPYWLRFSVRRSVEGEGARTEPEIEERKGAATTRTRSGKAPPGGPSRGGWRGHRAGRGKRGLRGSVGIERVHDLAGGEEVAVFLADVEQVRLVRA
jgi:hypothetical protein